MEDALDMLLDPGLELIGVFFAALSGGLAAVRKDFDVFGVLVLAWATGLGGGLIRDVLIDATPPVGISRLSYVLTALLAGVVIFLFRPGVERMRRVVVVFDAFALAFFVMLGTVKGLEYGVGALAAIFAGVVTGVGGGIMRDVLVSEVPLVLADRQLYAIPAFVGAGLTAWLWSTGNLSPFAKAGVVVLVIGFRLLSLRLGWVVPGARAGWSGWWGMRRPWRR